MRQGLQGSLPGGRLTADGLRRDYAFRPLDGALELALAEIPGNAAHMPEAVSRALEASLAHLGGVAPSPAVVDALCVADRQYLMRHLAVLTGRHGDWFSAVCNHCGSRFDFALDYAALPVKPAGAGFPHVDVDLAGKRRRLRLPTGADQARMLSLPAAARPTALLAALVCDAEPLPADLDADAIRRIDEALDAIAPAVVLEVAAECPDCRGIVPAGLDPYEVLQPDGGDLLVEVHRIAWHYHWAEAEILALPRPRRQQYLHLIDGARGMTQ